MALTILSVGNIIFYVSLGIFALKAKIPALIVRKDRELKGLSAEQALYLIKEKLENGLITEDEYARKRAKIINKL